jgi:RimJ/RimL family protein N-acetyltransferase
MILPIKGELKQMKIDYILFDYSNMIDILKIHTDKSVAKYINISHDYIKYVTRSDNVKYYGLYMNDILVGGLQIDFVDKQINIAIMIIQNFQKKGIATSVLKDLKNNALCLPYKKIRGSIESKNEVSIRLFGHSGFNLVDSKDNLNIYEHVLD